MIAYSKQAERDVAFEFGGRRLSAGEWQGEGDVDVLPLEDGGALAIQVKHRTGLPKWFLEGMTQIKDAVKDKKELRRMGILDTDYLLPIMVIKTKPGQGKESKMYIVLELEDWGDWYLSPN